MTPSILEFDYALVRACLKHKKFAWEDFVDRFAEQTLRVVEHTAEVRRVALSEEEKVELCEAIFRSYRYNDYQLLREFAFRGAVSTYLTVLADRLAVAFLNE
ncbi:MAG: hypothetical protein IKU86_03965 [Thermoguttaceae bacterium]|nr:hypothetical protein [Thermoguttaceae bacterium]